MILVTSATKYISREVKQLNSAGAWCSIYNRAKLFKTLIAGVTVLGVSSLTPQLTLAQSNSASSSQEGVGNFLNYSFGTRVYQNGRISTPSGSTIYPNTTINNGNGSTTYYYPNGTRVNIKNNTVTPSGALLRSGSYNGGLTTSPSQTFPIPRSFNGGLRNR